MTLFSERLTDKACQIWEEDFGEPLSDSEAQKLLEDLTGFYGLLWEWSQEDEQNKDKK